MRLILLAPLCVAAIWQTRTRPSPSCSGPWPTSSDAPVSDPYFAPSDPTALSVDLGRLAIGARAGCFAFHAPECPFDVEAMDSLEFDVSAADCGTVWAAPLWLEPAVWRGGALSGEIDLFENCPAGAFRANFAGAAPFLHQGAFSGESAHVRLKYRHDIDAMLVFAHHESGAQERLVSWYLGYAEHTNCDKGCLR